MTAALWETTENLTTGANETLENISTRAQSPLDEVTTRRDEVERLYRVIADTGTAGAFAEDAKVQQMAADTWR